jgi:hypothetical protein
LTRARIRRAGDGAWALAIAVWSFAVLGGMSALWRYKLSASRPWEPPVRWPDESALVRDGERATLVMSVHPKCSCSRASLTELARVLAGAHGLLAAHVLFIRPRGAPPEWEDTDTWRQARRIPGLDVHVDPDGAEARRFGASVSGSTAVYDARGDLLFHGGITGARGHEGDNFGRARLLSLVTGGPADRPDSPTFGCDLESAAERQGQGER